MPESPWPTAGTEERPEPNTRPDMIRKTTIRFLAGSLLAVSAPFATAQVWEDISANVPGPLTEEQFQAMASGGGHLHALGRTGVYVSSDGGNSFSAVNQVAGGFPDLAGQSLRFIKQVNGSIWIGGSGVTGEPGVAGPRLHRLTPGETVWQPRSGGLPGDISEGAPEDITHDPVSGNHFITLSTGTVYVSTDDGASWQARSNGLGGIGSPSTIAHAGGAVLASRPLAGVLRTTDQGGVWQPSLAAGSASVGMMIPHNGRLLVMFDRTIHLSDDGGLSWGRREGLSHGSSVLTSDGTNVYAVSRNNQVFQNLAYSASGGLAWHLLTREGLPPVPTFAGYHPLHLMRHGNHLYLTGVTLNPSFLWESSHLHRLDVSGFDFLNELEIAIQPAGRRLLVGRSHLLQVHASGKDLTYQWRKDGQDLPGATSRTLLLSDVGMDDSGDYTVRVRAGTEESVTSATATVTVVMREEGKLDPGFDQTDVTAGGRVHLLPGGEAIVVRTDTTSLNLYRIGADGGRLLNSTATTTSGNNLSNSLIDRDGRIVAAFKPASNTSALRRYDPESFALQASLFFDNGTAVRVRDIAEVPGVGYAVAGQFNEVGGTARKDFVVVGYDHLPSAFAAGSGPNAAVDSVTVGSGGQIHAAGGFTFWNGVSTPRGLARIDPGGNVHTVDTGIPGTTTASFLHALPDGRLLVRFGTGAQTLHALLPGGGRDTGFNTAGHAITGNLRAAVQTDGKIILAGGFSQFGGVPAAGYIRLHPDGTVDGGFHTATGFSGGTINDVTYDPRGYIYLSVASSGGSGSATFQGVGPVGRGPVRIFAGAAEGEGPAGGFASWAALLALPEDQRGPQDKPAGDDIPNLVKYALGVNPLESARHRLPAKVVEAVQGEEGYPAVTYIRDKGATGVTITVEISASLEFPGGIGSTLVSAEDLGDGTERVTVRSNATFASLSKQFFRLKAAAP